MATELKFTKNDNGHWEAEFESEGNPIAIEVSREEEGYLLVMASLDDLEKVMQYNSGSKGSKTELLELDIPEGVTITVVSHTKVIKAKATGI